MTDFELIDAFATHATLLITFFMAFISGTSALLVVAHVAADNMPPALARVVIVIYIVTSLFLIGAFQRITQVGVGIRGEMGDSLNWHPLVNEADWLFPILSWTGVVAMGVISIGTIWYFQYARTANR